MPLLWPGASYCQTWLSTASTGCMGTAHLLVQFFALSQADLVRFLAILMFCVLPPPSGPRSQVLLDQAKQLYFELHPDFAPTDHNYRRVNNLTHSHSRGKHSHEFCRLMEVIEQNPLHQQFTVGQAGALASPLSRASSVSLSRASSAPRALTPPWWRRAGRGPMSRSRSRPSGRARPKAKHMPKVKLQAPPKVVFQPPNNKFQAKPMPKAARPLSSGSGESSCSMSEVLDDADDGDDEELSQEDWVQMDCWACKARGYFNLRFTQWCTCGVQRESQQQQHWPWALALRHLWQCQCLVEDTVRVV